MASVDNAPPISDSMQPSGSIVDNATLVNATPLRAALPTQNLPRPADKAGERSEPSDSNATNLLSANVLDDTSELEIEGSVVLTLCGLIASGKVRSSLEMA